MQKYNKISKIKYTIEIKYAKGFLEKMPQNAKHSSTPAPTKICGSMF